MKTKRTDKQYQFLDAHYAFIREWVLHNHRHEQLTNANSFKPRLSSKAFATQLGLLNQTDAVRRK